MKHFAFVLFAGLLPVSSCAVSSEPETVVVSGESVLTVRWTVDGSSDPRACAAEGADAIDLVVETPSGLSVAEAVEGCELSETHIALAPGRYEASAVLLDAGGHTITTAVELGPITIYENDELIVDADFPPDSFY
jgi:hypothetical protein